MKDCSYGIVAVSICIGLFVFFVGQQQVQAQKEKHLNLWDIRKVLMFWLSINTSVAELNKRLIEDVNKRGVNFILFTDDEESLKNAGGSDLLIKTIRKNLPKKLREKLVLYQKYVNNYHKTHKHRMIALKLQKNSWKNMAILQRTKK